MANPCKKIRVDETRWNVEVRTDRRWGQIDYRLRVWGTWVKGKGAPALYPAVQKELGKVYEHQDLVIYEIGTSDTETEITGYYSRPVFAFIHPEGPAWYPMSTEHTLTRAQMRALLKDPQGTLEKWTRDFDAEYSGIYATPPVD